MSPRDRSPDKQHAKRRKVSRACDSCKQRKSKCSGTMPCTVCVSRRMLCLYQANYARGRPPTPRMISPSRTSSPPSVPAGRNNQAPVDTESSDQVANIPLGPVVPLSRASPELGLTEVEGQYMDPTSGLAFLQRAWKRLSGHGLQQRPLSSRIPDHSDDVFKQSQQCAGDKPLETNVGRQESPLNMPDPETATELLAFYFDVCIATYRFLHRPSVYKWMHQLQDNAEKGHSLSRDIGEMKASVVLTALAIATFHRGKSKDGRSPEEANSAIRDSDRLFVAAINLSDRATGYPSVESVQAKLIHTLYLLHSSRMNNAWYVFGNAIQTIAAMGLHRKTSRVRFMANNGAPGDYILSQCRRRCFWVAYTLDTYLGVILGRPRHYNDDSIDQEFPDAVNDEDMTSAGPLAGSRRYKDCDTESLIYHAKIAKIVAKTSCQVYAFAQPSDVGLKAFVEQIRQELQQWEKTLSPILGSVRPANLVSPFKRQATALRLAHCHATMHATRPFLLRNPRSNDHQEQAVEECLSAAQEVLELVDDMAQDGTLFHAFWWTHYVLFCSLSVVYIWKIQMRRMPNPFDFSASRTRDGAGLFQLALRCQQHLADATASSAPNRRYSIILDEMRQEAVSQPSVDSHNRQLWLSQNKDHSEFAGNASGGVVEADIDASTILEPLPGGFIDADNGWQNLDWLDIDSLAFGPFPESFEQT